MTIQIGSNPTPAPQVQGAQEAGPAQGGARAGGATAEKGIARELVPPGEAREQAVALRHAGQVALRGSAQPGRESFLERVKRWVRENLGSCAGLPGTVELTMPDGSKVCYPGEELACMVKALPRAEREAAREGLVATLEARLRAGGAISGSVGSGLPPPGAREVSDLMLYLRSREIQLGRPAGEDSCLLGDREGALYRYIASCPASYARPALRALPARDVASAEPAAARQAPGLSLTERGTRRAVDIPAGPYGLTGNHGSVLFGSVPPAGGEPRRLLVRMTGHGSRLSLGRTG